jgi:hypothetical protein
MPVLSIVSCQHCQDNRDYRGEPTPGWHVIDECHPITATAVPKWNCPHEAGNEEAKSHPEKETWTRSFESRLAKVAVLHVDFQGLTKSKQKTIQ